MDISFNCAKQDELRYSVPKQITANSKLIVRSFPLQPRFKSCFYNVSVQQLHQRRNTLSKLSVPPGPLFLSLMNGGGDLWRRPPAWRATSYCTYHWDAVQRHC